MAVACRHLGKRHSRGGVGSLELFQPRGGERLPLGHLGMAHHSVYHVGEMGGAGIHSAFTYGIALESLPHFQTFVIIIGIYVFPAISLG